MEQRTLKNIAIYTLIVLIALFAIKWTSPVEEAKKAIDYNTFYQAVLNDKVKSVVITPERDIYQVEGVFKDGKAFTTTALWRKIYLKS